MIIPIRCWSCGKPIGHLWEKFKARVQAGEAKKAILDDFGLTRYCCRTALLSHVDLIDIAARYKKP